MESTKAVGIKDLKNRLSAYINEVKRGIRVLVTDRGQVVAELREPFTHPSLGGKNPIVATWIQEEKVRPPRMPLEGVPSSPLSLPAGTALELLDAGRGE